MLPIGHRFCLFRNADNAWMSLLPNQTKDKIRLHLPGCEPNVAKKIVNSSRSVVLNEIQWFILVTFVSIVAKREGYELGYSHHTISM